MLNVTKYIHENGLDNLISKFNLVARYSKRYPNLVQLCYHQLDTPKNEITNECRGIILDKTDNFKVISYPFYRFNDYNTNTVKGIDLDSIRFYEKIDGSVISMYYYDDNWFISTKTLPDADGKILNLDLNFKEAFFRTFNELGYSLPKDVNKTYVFEFTFNNQGITIKEKSNISLLMVRDMDTLLEEDHEKYAIANGWDYVRSLDINSLDEALKIVRNLDPTVSEGFVACDKNFYRLKIKSPQYENIAELKINYDNTDERQKIIEKDNFRRLCEIIRTNDCDTFIHLPKYASIKKQYFDIKKAYQELLSTTLDKLSTIKNLHGKELGLYLKNEEKWLSGICFGISSGKIDVNNPSYLKDYFFNMNIKTFEEIIRKKL